MQTFILYYIFLLLLKVGFSELPAVKTEYGSTLKVENELRVWTWTLANCVLQCRHVEGIGSIFDYSEDEMFSLNVLNLYIG